MSAPAPASVAHRRRSFTRGQFLNNLTLLVVSIGLTLVPVALYWRERTFLVHAVGTRGTVVSVDVIPTSRRSFNYTPTIRFTDREGQTWTVLSRAPGRVSYKAGQELPVLYDVRYPSLVQPDDPASNAANWHFGLAFAITGLVLLPVGFYQTVSTARELARQRRGITPAGP